MNSRQIHASLSESDLEAIHKALISSGNADLAALFIQKEDLSPEAEKYVSLARKSRDYDLEIEEAPLVSIGDDGAWVAAWVWVDGSQEELAVA
ncbi:MAG: hypothetical protein RLZZ505_516 [Verrucomicrobiota bacterium]|jgi:hypothetical protein